jgi:Leucine-rich repeat (LRR) protein
MFRPDRRHSRPQLTKDILRIAVECVRGVSTKLSKVVTETFFFLKGRNKTIAEGDRRILLGDPHVTARWVLLLPAMFRPDRRRRRRPQLNHDILQIVVEYTHEAADILNLRGVSTNLSAVVAETFFFLNGRNKTNAEGDRRILLGDPHVTARCVLLCLRDSLTSVNCINLAWRTDQRPLHERRLFEILIHGFTNSADNSILTTLVAQVGQVHGSKLHHLKSVEELSLDGDTTDLPVWCLARMSSLTYLKLSGGDGVIALLRRCPANLRTLCLAGEPIGNMSFVSVGAGLYALRMLDLSGCVRFSDVRTLKQCRALESLLLRGSGIRSLDGLTALPALRSVDVRNTNIAEVVDELLDLRMTDLEVSLDLVGSRGAIMDFIARVDEFRISRLSLQKLSPHDAVAVVNDVTENPSRQHELLELDLSGVASLDVVQCVSRGHLVVLKALNLSGSANFSDVSDLKNCASLTELNLSGTSVTDRGIRGLELIPGLTVIDLHGCKSVTDVSFLRKSSVTSLDVSYTGVTAQGIVGLGDCKELKHLKMCDCPQLDNIDALATVQSLTHLDVAWCPLISVAKLQTLPNLVELNLNGCLSVTDLGTVELWPALVTLPCPGLPPRNTPRWGM